MERTYPDEFEYLVGTLELIDSELARFGDGMESDEQKLAQERRYMWQELPAASTDWEELSDMSAQLSVLQEQEKRWVEKDRQNAVLLKMRSSPYFGRVDFTEKGSSESEKFYIGLANLMDKRDYRMLVCDWRAPVASLYYDNGRGPTVYECPEGSIEGTVELLRQYRIEDSELKLVIDSDIRLDDTILQDALLASSSEHMRTIVSSIQKEQNSVIRDSGNDMLIVLGPAGSGKTSIALHRIAYLLYRERNNLTSDNILIFSPNDVFCGYISQVIPELGEPSVSQTTFSDLISRYCSVPVGGMFEQSEFLHAPDDRVRFDGIRFKSSGEFVELAKEFISAYLPKFTDVIFGDTTIINAATLKKLYTDDLSHLSLSGRLSKLRELIFHRFGPAEQEFRRALRDEVAAESFDKWQFRTAFKQKYDSKMSDTYAQIAICTELDYVDLYKKFLYFAIPQWSDPTADKTAMLRQADSLAENGRLNFEDGVGVLLLTALSGAVPPPKKIRHIVLDELQDYTAAQHEILSILFKGCSFTMLGDLSQLINPYAGLTDPEEIPPIYSLSRFAIKKLTKSYRSTVEITDFAKKLLTLPEQTEQFERHGEPVKTLLFSSDRERISHIAEELSAHTGGSSVVLTKTVAEARQLYQMLHRKNSDLRLLASDDTVYHTGLWVMPVALAKGLEFDRVILADSSLYESELDRGLLYVACTRAMQSLTVLSTGNHSPLFGGIK
ncbi:MAG: AAA family ATPase [Clostridia bacterium]|nr:AAA family ATPase [Clostridia bacterium]